MFTTLIQAEALSDLAQQPRNGVLILDCSFDLADPQRGRALYANAHIPGAIYVDVEAVLSGKKTGSNGRHPLPAREAFASHIAQLGADNDTQVVVYDRSEGMFAARAWWMFRWIGHQAVAVLDGGFDSWTRAGYRVQATVPANRPKGSFSLREPLVRTTDRETVFSRLGDQATAVIDARSPDRYRGENETLDSAAGHIPGAYNRFFRDNLDTEGRFKPKEQLASEFNALLAAPEISTLVSQCGSGVTACHNMLSLEIAGIENAGLYPGSWSEWSATPGMPIATGNESGR
jgi:thiosulfate/3-mercaptopyruvate sulfurtransferase